MLTRKRLAVATFIAMALPMIAVTGAFATDPVPPTDPSGPAATVLANLGNGVFTVLTSMASNVWIIALFTAAVALGIVKRVISKHKSHSIH
jgi:hypothetical protein